VSNRVHSLPSSSTSSVFSLCLISSLQNCSRLGRIVLRMGTDLLGAGVVRELKFISLADECLRHRLIGPRDLLSSV
jgi:hypothetical protein